MAVVANLTIRSCGSINSFVHLFAASVIHSFSRSLVVGSRGPARCCRGGGWFLAVVSLLRSSVSCGHPVPGRRVLGRRLSSWSLVVVVACCRAHFCHGVALAVACCGGYCGRCCGSRLLLLFCCCGCFVIAVAVVAIACCRDCFLWRWLVVAIVCCCARSYRGHCCCGRCCCDVVALAVACRGCGRWCREVALAESRGCGRLLLRSLCRGRCCRARFFRRLAVVALFRCCLVFTVAVVTALLCDRCCCGHCCRGCVVAVVLSRYRRHVRLVAVLPSRSYCRGIAVAVGRWLIVAVFRTFLKLFPKRKHEKQKFVIMHLSMRKSSQRFMFYRLYACPLDRRPDVIFDIVFIVKLRLTLTSLFLVVNSPNLSLAEGRTSDLVTKAGFWYVRSRP